MPEKPSSKRTPAVILEVTPQMLAVAEQLVAQGMSLEHVGPTEGQSCKEFLAEEARFLPEFQALLDDMRRYPNEPEVKRAYERALEKMQTLGQIRALLLKQAVDERARIPDNELH